MGMERQLDFTSGYSTQTVEDLVGMNPEQVRRFARRNLVAPGKGPKGEYRFAFQDLVLLRTAKCLFDRDVSPRKVFSALSRLQAGGPEARPLTSVRVLAQGGAVVVRDQDRLWHAESGQGYLDFSRGGAGPAVASMWGEKTPLTEEGDDLSSGEWCQLGVDLEEWDPAKAFEAYGRAVMLNPNNADAHVNLGRLHQLKGDLKNAKRHYELAVESAPEHQLANYNLGTVFDELSEGELAAGFYRKAPDVPDAHYNLARIHRQNGDELGYRRHCQCYQRLVEQQG